MNFASGTPTSYLYTTDHLGSTREMTKTVSGTTTIEAQYGYDPYGIATKLQGSQDADFQYAGYYMHAPSGLSLTLTRQYSAALGRWITRDPIEENGGINLYGYAGGNPIMYSDPWGLKLKIQGDESQYAAAKEYLTKNNPEAKKLFKYIESKKSPNFTLVIECSGGEGSKSNLSNLTTFWDPNLAARHGGGTNSPAMVLLHEFAHLRQKATYQPSTFAAMDVSDPTWGTLLDRDIINNIEARSDAILGENQRQSHNVDWYQVSSPASR